MNTKVLTLKSIASQTFVMQESNIGGLANFDFIVSNKAPNR